MLLDIYCECNEEYKKTFQRLLSKMHKNGNFQFNDRKQQNVKRISHVA